MKCCWRSRHEIPLIGELVTRYAGVGDKSEDSHQYDQNVIINSISENINKEKYRISGPSM